MHSRVIEIHVVGLILSILHKISALCISMPEINLAETVLSETNLCEIFLEFI